MHMADALISPAVGGTLWAATAGLLLHSARNIRDTAQGQLVPMMGVLGAFIFTAQMINFAIPGTGSSGHLGGGLLLAILLGPHAAFLVMASVLTVQALFFADGGLLALGCNIFNLGFLPAFIAYPLVYRIIAQSTSSRASAAAIAAAVVGLQLGALSVVIETQASGITELPFGAFILLMSPIHLAIGVVEGLATAAVVAFVRQARPYAMPELSAQSPAPRFARAIFPGLLLSALLVGGAGSWFASTRPDGLEWSLARASRQQGATGLSSTVHHRLAALQQKTAWWPDYQVRTRATPPEALTVKQAEPWPAVAPGTSIAGLVGGTLTLGLATLIGIVLKPRRTAV
ncbi:MAG: energy-coupling factor ABC transporter permease [Lentisphaerae bacterium]|nr:energy-coupling factor ABC transporter permease [Lentisphaerota bacterium]